MAPYTQIRLDVEDVAPASGFGDRRRRALAGNDRVIRVAPRVARAFEAGPDGLELLAVGPHHAGDVEPVNGAWVARPSSRESEPVTGALPQTAAF